MNDRLEFHFAVYAVIASNGRPEWRLEPEAPGLAEGNVCDQEGWRHPEIPAEIRAEQRCYENLVFRLDASDAR